MGQRPRGSRALGEAAMAVVGDRGAEVAVVVEGDERADDLGIGGTFAHGGMIPGGEAPPRPRSTSVTSVTPVSGVTSVTTDP